MVVKPQSFESDTVRPRSLQLKAESKPMKLPCQVTNKTYKCILGV